MASSESSKLPRAHGSKLALLALRFLVAAVMVLFLVPAVLVTIGAIVPDARSRLSPADRRRLDTVSDTSPMCGWPWSRVAAATVSESRVTWTCEWGLPGLVRSRGTARCIDGNWEVQGYGGPEGALDC